MSVTSLAIIYQEREAALQQAANRLRSILVNVVARIEDKALVRAEVTNVRVKDLSSLERKAAAKGWRPNEVLSICSDLIGGRVVCNNIEDVYRFAELLQEELPNNWSKFDIQDHIKSPHQSGYRALHVNFGLDVGSYPMQLDRVPCEVQIRSRLQDAWAELSHDDIYKRPSLPEDLRGRATDLAEVLAAADKIASGIRARVTEATATPEHRPNLAKISEEGLAFIFKETFGRSPPKYVIRQALNRCEELGVKSLEGLSDILGNTSLRSKMQKAYRLIMPTPIGNDEIFLASLDVIANGEERAIARVRDNARREWNEIDQFARREMLASLPETIEELVETLESSSSDSDSEIENWAAALQTTADCAICGTTIVDPSSFSEAALEYYSVSDVQADKFGERIETALMNSGVETGGWGDGSLCAYHQEQMAKDD